MIILFPVFGIPHVYHGTIKFLHTIRDGIRPASNSSDDVELGGATLPEEGLRSTPQHESTDLPNTSYGDMYATPRVEHVQQPPTAHPRVSDAAPTLRRMSSYAAWPVDDPAPFRRLGLATSPHRTSFASEPTPTTWDNPMLHQPSPSRPRRATSYDQGFISRGPLNPPDEILTESPQRVSTIPAT